MKRLFLVPALFLIGCASTTVGVAVASLGIAGVALETYCLTGGVGCSPAVISYGRVIVSEATRDALILETGQATAAQITAIAANLQLLLAGGAIPGLTPAEQQEISAITAAISVLLPLVQAILPPHSAPVAQSVSLPHLTGKDKRELAKMHVRMKALPPHK